MKEYQFRDLLKMKVLILGDVGSGKTVFTARLLDQAIRLGLSDQITVLDLAPPPRMRGGRTIGGYLKPFISDTGTIIYLMVENLYSPRLDGRSGVEVLNMASENARIIEELFSRYIMKPTKVLFINDASMYLHAGDLKKFYNLIEKTETLIANAYSGNYFDDDCGSGVSEREKKAISELQEKMNLVIRLNHYEMIG